MADEMVQRWGCTIANCKSCHYSRDDSVKENFGRHHPGVTYDREIHLREFQVSRQEMELRKNVKAPRRFEDEDDLVQSSRRIPKHCIPDPRYVKPYIDFDPTLPPAAFPSLPLDEPLPSSDDDDLDDTSPQAAATRVGNHDGLAPSPEPSAEVDDELTVDEAPELDYGQVMTIARHVEDETEQDDFMTNLKNIEKDMETSDEEEDMGNEDDGDKTYERREQNQSSSWTDIAPSLQTEIVGNLLTQGKDPYEICAMLGIGESELEVSFGYLRQQNQQIEKENRAEKDMQAEQLRALLRTDNSLPPTLRQDREDTLGEISKKHLHQGKVNEDEDRSMCTRGELRQAQNYLHLRGLKLDLAGEWA